jgi:soluble lytic murein transglycosylase
VTLSKTLISLSLIAVSAPVLAAPAEVAQSRPSWAPQLGPNAASRYREIFTAIKAGSWADAQAKLDAMPEGPLHNVARAELYLAKGSPRVEGAALAALAEKAPELPQSRTLAALAEARGVVAMPVFPSQQELYWLGTAPRRGKAAGSEARGLALAGRIIPLLKNDQPNDAEALLEASSGSLDTDTKTEWQHRIAWSYFLTGDEVAARRLATIAATGTGEFAAQADWVAGLAAWRLKDFDAASISFASAAKRLTDAEIWRRAIPNASTPR